MRRIYAGKTSVGKMDVDLYGDLDDSLFSSGLEQRAVEEVRKGRTTKNKSECNHLCR